LEIVPIPLDSYLIDEWGDGLAADLRADVPSILDAIRWTSARLPA
jgi:hypothetical protein